MNNFLKFAEKTKPENYNGAIETYFKILETETNDNDKINRWEKIKNGLYTITVNQIINV